MVGLKSLHFKNDLKPAMPIKFSERACEPLLGSDDGKWILESIFAALKNKTVAAKVHGKK